MIQIEKLKRACMLLAVFPMLFFASYSNDNLEGTEPGGTTGTNGGDIRFEIDFAPQTRAATDATFNSTWENDDEIGIFAVRMSRKD